MHPQLDERVVLVEPPPCGIWFAVAAAVGVLVVKELGLQGAVFGHIGLLKDGAVFWLIGK